MDTISTQLNQDIHTASIEMLGTGETRKQRQWRRFNRASYHNALMNKIAAAVSQE